MPSASAAASASAEAPGDAKAKKAKARALLERRKLSEAIEAAERSTVLDPTDGEAWLILGAALQEKGDLANARRAYASCVKEGKKGPRNECANLLR
jgi:Flp pilus assembly protein TadD